MAADLVKLADFANLIVKPFLCPHEKTDFLPKEKFLILT